MSLCIDTGIAKATVDEYRNTLYPRFHTSYDCSNIVRRFITEMKKHMPANKRAERFPLTTIQFPSALSRTCNPSADGSDIFPAV